MSAVGSDVPVEVDVTELSRKMMPGFRNRRRFVELCESHHNTPRACAAFCALASGRLRRDWQEFDIHGRARALSHEFDWHVRARLGTDDHASDIRSMRYGLFADPHDDVAGCDPGVIGRPVRLYLDHGAPSPRCVGAVDTPSHARATRPFVLSAKATDCT
jgi:hypothetical protein